MFCPPSLKMIQGKRKPTECQLTTLKIPILQQLGPSVPAYLGIHLVSFFNRLFLYVYLGFLVVIDLLQATPTDSELEFETFISMNTCFSLLKKQKCVIYNKTSLEKIVNSSFSYAETF